MALVVLMTGALPAAAVGPRGEIIACVEASGARTVRIGDGRLLAPTRPATFFHRPGNRCAAARGRLAG